MKQVQADMERSFEQTKGHFGVVEEQISNLNQKFQSSNDELTKKLAEVLEAVRGPVTKETYATIARPSNNQTVSNSSTVRSTSFNSAHTIHPNSSPVQLIHPLTVTQSNQINTNPISLLNFPPLTRPYTQPPSSQPPYTQPPYTQLTFQNQTYNPAYMGYNLNTTIYSSTTEPHLRPFNTSTHPTSTTKHSLNRIIYLPWTTITEIPQTIGISASQTVINNPNSSSPCNLILPQFNNFSPYQPMHQQSIPSSHYQPFSNPPITACSPHWMSYNEGLSSRPMSHILPFPIPKMDFPKFEGKD